MGHDKFLELTPVRKRADESFCLICNDDKALFRPAFDALMCVISFVDQHAFQHLTGALVFHQSRLTERERGGNRRREGEGVGGG